MFAPEIEVRSRYLAEFGEKAYWDYLLWTYGDNYWGVGDFSSIGQTRETARTIQKIREDFGQNIFNPENIFNFINPGTDQNAYLSLSE